MDIDLFVGPHQAIAHYNRCSLRAMNVIKVPQEVYQCMYDIALAKGASEASKWQVMKVLEEWVEESYPEHKMVASLELSAEEAREAQRRYPGLEWGIYVKIAPRQKKLEESIKQVTY